MLALSASLFWSVSPLFFASAGRRIGAFSLNLLRLVFGGFLLWVTVLVLALFRGEIHFPGTVPLLWVTLSAATGLILGDMLYYKALIAIGPRRITQILTFIPVISVTVAWTLFGEKLGLVTLGGISLIITGILYAVMYDRSDDKSGPEPSKFSPRGFFIGLGGVVCHGFAAVFTRQAYYAEPGMDPLLATALRVGSAALMLFLAALISGQLQHALNKLGQKKVSLVLVFGTLAGPVSGMFCYVAAFKFMEAGAVSALAGLSPLFILPIIAIRYRTKISFQSLMGTTIAMGGVVLMNVGWI